MQQGAEIIAKTLMESQAYSSTIMEVGYLKLKMSKMTHIMIVVD